MTSLRPTSDELKRWLDSTLRHCCMVEYYLHHLGEGGSDPQRPHDITGEGNKFGWDVMSGLALHYRDDSPEFFEQYVLPSIERHRQYQYHHQMWNHFNPKATPDDMKVGAVDTICSLLDDRPYQGGSHSFEEIMYVIRANEPHKVKWMWMVYSRMKALPTPDINGISYEQIPDIGLPEDTQIAIVQRTCDALALLGKKGYSL